MRSITAPVGRGSVNRNSDVMVVQQLLNYQAYDLAVNPIRLDGQPSSELFEAIETFQDKVCHMRRPDGVIEPGKRTFKKLSRITIAQRADFDRDWVVPWAPKWIRMAGSQLGVHEYRGFSKNNPEVMKFIDTVPALKTCEIERGGVTKMCGDVDESAWCGCFVNWCLIQSGYPGHIGIDAARARKWVNYGKDLKMKPEYGAITVIYAKINGKGTNHVGFYMGERNGRTVLLGGNQENGGKPGGKVCVSEFSGWTVKGFTWPLHGTDDD